MHPDEPERAIPEFPEGHRESFLRGVIYGFQIGREFGFGEGVQAMHRAITKVLQSRRADEGG